MGSALLNPPPAEPASRELAAPPHAPAPIPPDALRRQIAERLAEHRTRRSRLRPQPDAEAIPTPSPRTARIAASVAERFAHTPSYRAFLAAEAERATQQAQAAAEIAALNAQAVAQVQQQLLESLYPDSDSEATDEHQQQHHDGELAHELSLWPEPDPVTNPHGQSSPASSERVKDRADARPSTAHRSKPRTDTGPTPGLVVHLFDAPTLHPTAPPNPVIRQHPQEDDDEARALDDEISFRQSPVFEEPAGPPMPLPANLIEFPRQLVAPRKVRPRYAEGPLRDDDALASNGSQLRIFEVDAAQISTTPNTSDPTETPTPQWTSLWLDAPNPPAAPATPDATTTETLRNPDTAPPRRHAAPISRRLLAAAIDASFILTGFLASVATFASITLHAAAPSGAYLSYLTLAAPALAGGQPTTVLAVATAAIAFLYLLYQLLFFSLAEATPGMRYVRIALCTFTDENPSRPAMRRRILAVLLSACSLGLGFLWAALDEDRLTWHDLISRIYQRSY
jgi:uncharacterized RDD family membrane protein YckC